MPVNNWNGSLGQTSRLYRAQPVPALLRQRINDEEAARAQRMRARTGQAPLPMVPGQQAQGPQPNAQTAAGPQPQPVSQAPQLVNVLGQRATREQQKEYNKYLMDIQRLRRMAGTPTQQGPVPMPSANYLPQSQQFTGWANQGAARAPGQQIMSFDAWRAQQKGMMGFDYSQYDGSPSSQLRMRQDLDNTRLDQMISSVTAQPGTPAYADSLAQIYERAGRTEDAQRMKDLSVNLQRMQAEQGGAQALQRQKDQAAASRQQADLAERRRKEQIEADQFEQTLALSREQLEIAKQELAVAQSSAQSTAANARNAARVSSLEKELDRLQADYKALRERANTLYDRSTDPENASRDADSAAYDATMDEIARLRQRMADTSRRIEGLQTGAKGGALPGKPSTYGVAPGQIITSPAGERFRATANDTWEPVNGQAS
jgi:hypothetical protein